MRPFLVFTFWLVAHFAQAEDWEGVTPWKFIAGDGSVTTSKCVGSNGTLECLIDTVMACSAWSEEPRFRADYIFYDAPVCFSPGLVLKPFGAFNTYGPVATETYLYRTESWPIDGPEGWHNPKIAEAGDVAVDFFTMTCSPNPGCLEDLDPLLPADEVLTRCPRTFCVDNGPYAAPLSVTHYGFSPDEVHSIVFPGGTFLTGQTPDGWMLLDWYAWYSTGGEPWIADHWKRK